MTPSSDTEGRADACDFCGKSECPCYDESDPDTIVPNDSTTNPAIWGGDE